MATTRVSDPAGSDDATDETIDRSRLRLALTRTVFEQGNATLFIGFACLLMGAAMLHGAVPDGPLLTWLVLGVAAVAARVPLTARAARLPDAALPYRRYLVLVACAGGVWGALPFFWSPALTVLERLVLILFPIALSVGVVSSYGPRRSLFFSFALPAQLPMVGVFLFTADGAYAALALPALLSLGGQSMLVLRYHRQFREMIELRIGHDALVRDLAERNEALGAARDEAEIANVAKTEFLARMSHEIRTPMNGVLGLADVLSSTSLDAEQARLLGTMRTSAGDLLGLLDELLDISHVENGCLELETRDYAPRSVLDEVVAAERTAAAARGLRFEWSVDAAVPARLHGDPGRLAQVVRNLLENAVRFTAEGSVRLRVTTAGVGAGRRLVLSVMDTGPGIAEDQLAHVFEPFRQGDGSSTRRIGGSGLGLALVREIVSLMGGEVQARSTLGVGSTFTVEVPLVAADDTPAPHDYPLAPSAVRTGAPSPEPSAHGTRSAPTVAPPAASARASGRASPVEPRAARPRGVSVLVAEDNPVNQMVIEAMLEGLGCEVRIAEDGAAALEALGEDDFDLVFMDCQMPVVDGLDATRAARERGLGLPIVAVTANAMAGDRERCLAVGMDDYLSKPFTSEALAAMVERWGRGERVAGATAA